MIVAFDTETFLVAPGRLAPPMVCLTYVRDRDVGQNQWTPPDLLRGEEAGARVRGWLQTPSCVLVGHNVAYDLGVLVQRWPDLWPLVWTAYDEGRVLDTQVAEQLRAIEDGTLAFDFHTHSKPDYSLAGLVRKHLGEEVEGKHGPDVWRLRYHELADVPTADWPAAARNYALLDAQYTARVFGAQVRRGLSPDIQQQCRAAWAFHLAGAWGIRTDPDMVAGLEGRLRQAVEEARGTLQAAGLVRPDGSKDMKAIRALVEGAYLDLGVTVPTTESGAVSTSAEVLRESKDPTLLALADVAGDEKELSSFVPVLHNGTAKPINPRWRVLVESGRSSCSGPNLQNQPRRHGVRECYVPRPGNVFLSADYSIAELRALAQILLWRYGQSAMADALRAGQDLHLVTAADFLEPSYPGDPMEAAWALYHQIEERPELVGAMAARVPGVRVIEHRCIVCDRPLDNPESIAAQLGPICRGRLSWAARDATSRAALLAALLLAARDRAAARSLEAAYRKAGCNTEADIVVEVRTRRHRGYSSVGVPYEDVVRRYKAKEPAAKDARQLAKAANFGFPGGLGAASFADFAKASYGLILSEDDTKAIKERWLGRYPEMRWYFQDVGALTNATGGRFTAEQYVSKRLRGQCGFTDGCNTYFQGLVADGAKAALYDVQRACYRQDGPLAGWRTVAFVHDEIILEGPELRATWAARELERLMVEAMARYTPDIPVLVEAAAMRRWNKDASPVWRAVQVPDGDAVSLLIPFEDSEEGVA